MALFELKNELYHETKRTYYTHLRRFILNKNIDGIKKLLEEVSVPEGILSYKVLRHASVEVLRLLIDAKIENDQFMDKVMEQVSTLRKDGNDDQPITADVIGEMSNKIESTFCDYYKMFLIAGLLRRGDGSYSLSRCDDSRYNKVQYYYEKMLCDGLHHGDATFVANCISEYMKRGYAITFDPKNNKLHQDTLDWMMDKINNPGKNSTSTWQSIPNSGPIPSNDPKDYLEALDVMKKFCVYE